MCRELTRSAYVNRPCRPAARLRFAQEVLVFEAVQFVEDRDKADPVTTVLASSDHEMEMVDVARAARLAFLGSGSGEYAWWVVREEGALLARFIADSKSDKEFALDLTSGELVEI